MLQEVRQEMTPLQKRLAGLGKVVALLCLGVCGAVFLAGVLRGEPVFDMLMTGITIAIAAIPEGLPATVTIALALAVSRMMKHQALVNRLHSVETLGCAGILCADKTGTITENDMTVTDLVISTAHFSVDQCIRQQGTAVSPEQHPALQTLLECCMLCTTAEHTSGTKSNRRPDRNRPANRSGKGWLLSGTLQATLSPPPYGTFRQRNQKDGSHGFLQRHRTAIPQGCSRPCVATLHTIAAWNNGHHADGIVSGRSPLCRADFVRTCSASIGVCLSGIKWRLDFSGVERYRDFLVATRYFFYIRCAIRGFWEMAFHRPYFLICGILRY